MPVGISPFTLPPPRIYMFPAIAANAGSPSTTGRALEQVELLDAFHRCFRGRDAEVNFNGFDGFDVEIRGDLTYLRTTVVRGGSLQKQSKMTSIRRG